METVVNNTVDSKTAADYLDPTREPEPSSETGPGTHFGNTMASAQEQPSAEKLAQTSSSMSTAELQKAAAEGDPNNLQKKK